MSDSSAINPEIIQTIALELKISAPQVQSTAQLILEECTIPFIARYRKERTGNLDEVQIRDIRDRYEYLTQLEERKTAILHSIEEQGKLTEELKIKIRNCQTKTLLEDLYLPFKPKKRTRGQIARERGLEPLAVSILNGSCPTTTGLEAAFLAAVGSHEELKTIEDVKKGCKDYIAETVSEVAELRQELRDWIFQNASYRSAVKDEYKDKKTKYNDYYDYTEPVSKIATHRLMALRRAEKEEIIRVSIVYDPNPPLSIVEKYSLRQESPADIKKFISECAQDAFERILSTSSETEIRLESKTIAEEDAIRVFSKNLRNLLLLPPIPSRTVLGIDPGIRTGSKIVIVDPTGKLLHYDTIHPVLDKDYKYPKNAQAMGKINDCIKKYNVECISVGNGTGSREVTELVQDMLDAEKIGGKVRLVVVNESGASVYSASDVAREEFPDLDVTIRGSVSIARRLQDPLAEFVKIDPKSIGVGQYQHDVNQSKLKKSLEEVVESCVNYVGVNLNTASASLLSYVAGIGPNLAKTIVRERESKGKFASRKALLEVHGFGPKAFEQSAGFLRIPDSGDPLDNTAVHPESYSIVESIAKSIGIETKELLGNKAALDKVKIEDFSNDKIGALTLRDILNELKKPGRDPREEGSSQKYSRNVRKIEDLNEGQVLDGTVTNVTNFGAFVDIGVHQDGLIHVSELSTEFIKDASEAIAVGARVKVMVIGVDKERKRISLSRKACMEGQQTPPSVGNRSQPTPAARNKGDQGRGPRESTSSKPNLKRSDSAHRPDSAKRREGAGAQASAARNSGPMRNEKKAPAPEPKLQKPSSLGDLMDKFKSHKV